MPRKKPAWPFAQLNCVLLVTERQMWDNLRGCPQGPSLKCFGRTLILAKENTPRGTGGTRLQGRGGGTVLASLSRNRRLWCVSEEKPCCVAMPTINPSLLTRTAMLLGGELRSMGWCIDGRGKGTHIRWQGEQKIILYLNRIVEMNKKPFKTITKFTNKLVQNK